MTCDDFGILLPELTAPNQITPQFLGDYLAILSRTVFQSGNPSGGDCVALRSTLCRITGLDLRTLSIFAE